MVTDGLVLDSETESLALLQGEPEISVMVADGFVLDSESETLKLEDNASVVEAVWLDSESVPGADLMAAHTASQRALCLGHADT